MISEYRVLSWSSGLSWAEWGMDFISNTKNELKEENTEKLIPEYRKRAFDFKNGLSWPIRLRLLLIVPWSCKWNLWIRDTTARFEGFSSYDDENTIPFTDSYSELKEENGELKKEITMLNDIIDEIRGGI